MNSTLERLVDDILAVVDVADAQDRVTTLVREAMADEEVAEAISGRVGLSSLEDMAIHRSERATILAAVLPAGFSAAPHNHNLWSVVGVARGREDNEFFERQGDGLVKVGGVNVEAPGVLPNAPDAIHTIANNLDEPLAALHVYGGDLFATPRSNWDPDTHEEIPFDWQKVSSDFAD